ncbi:hypothetical protein MRB53_039694 [Persea americana]|nr:hypothetical protein MRB53_039694 [Persea americana]
MVHTRTTILLKASVSILCMYDVLCAVSLSTTGNEGAERVSRRLMISIRCIWWYAMESSYNRVELHATSSTFDSYKTVVSYVQYSTRSRRLTSAGFTNFTAGVPLSQRAKPKKSGYEVHRDPMPKHFFDRISIAWPL